MAKKRKVSKNGIDVSAAQLEYLQDFYYDKSTITITVPQNAPNNSITVNGDNNNINIINSAISNNRFDNEPKFEEHKEKKSGIKGCIFGMLQSVITRIAQWILGE